MTRNLLAIVAAAACASSAWAGPCDSSETFEARRCVEAVATAITTVGEARGAITDLNGCATTKKKKDLQACSAELEAAARRLSRASGVLAAAAQAAAASPAEGETGMTRPTVERGTSNRMEAEDTDE